MALIVIPVLAMASGSDLIRAELLTWIDVEQGKRNGKHVINITNLGLVQADNAILTITTGDTRNRLEYKCVESIPYWYDEHTIVAKFQKISPNMPCEFKITGNVTSNPLLLLTFDGRVSTWKESMDPLDRLRLGLFPPFIVAGLFVICIVVIELREGIRPRLESHLRGRRLKKSHNACRIQQFVSSEYKVDIMPSEATILELIHSGKKTTGQIMAYSKLSKRYVVYCIGRMREYGIIHTDEMILDDALHQDAFKTWESSTQKKNDHVPDGIGSPF